MHELVADATRFYRLRSFRSLPAPCNAAWPPITNFHTPAPLLRKHTLPECHACLAHPEKMVAEPKPRHHRPLPRLCPVQATAIRTLRIRSVISAISLSVAISGGATIMVSPVTRQ